MSRPKGSKDKNPRRARQPGGPGTPADKNRWTRYGMSIAEYAALPKECRVCGKTDDLCVDHDHTTGAWRDLLCRACNRALGFLGEDADRAEALADYIRSL